MDQPRLTARKLSYCRPVSAEVLQDELQWAQEQHDFLGRMADVFEQWITELTPYADVPATFKPAGATR